MSAALFPRPDLRRLARKVVKALREAGEEGLTMRDLKSDLGLSSRARLVVDVVRTLWYADVVTRKLEGSRLVNRLLREPSALEMSAPPAPAVVPARLLARVVATERSGTSRLSWLLRERDGERWLALSAETRPPGGEWHSRKSLAVRLEEVDDVVEALLDAAREAE